MTQTHEQAVTGLSDAQLIEAVRHGSTEAFGTLYERHRTAARRASTYLARSEAEREEVVAEAFARILRVLKAGKGPTEEFRPYLLRTMRNIAINTTRQQSPLSPVADMAVFDSPTDAEDPATADFNRQMITRAFSSLPERWRTVLWHTEVEGETPASVAVLLGMSPNGVAALAYRAREGLSRAYLQMHLPTEERLDCRASRAKLGGYVRESLSDAEMRKVRDHLDDCDRCRALVAGLTEVNRDLRAVIGPVVLGIPLATAYLGKSAAAGTLVAPAKSAAGAAKTAAGHVIAKVAVVIAASVALGGAASYPSVTEPVAAPTVPRVHPKQQAAEQPAPGVPAVPTQPPTQPPGQPAPDTPEQSTAVPTPAEPAPAPAEVPEPPVEVPELSEITVPPVPPVPVVTPPPPVDDCRKWHAKPGCGRGGQHGANPHWTPPGRGQGHGR